MLVKYITGGKPSEAFGLENPTLPPLLWWKERKHLHYVPLCLFTFWITPCSSWTMFQCVLLCFLSNRISMRVVFGHVWLTHAHTLPFNFHSVPEVPFALPPPPTKHRRTAKGNFKVAGGGTPFSWHLSSSKGPAAPLITLIASNCSRRLWWKAPWSMLEAPVVALRSTGGYYWPRHERERKVLWFYLKIIGVEQTLENI